SYFRSLHEIDPEWGRGFPDLLSYGQTIWFYILLTRRWALRWLPSLLALLQLARNPRIRNQPKKRDEELESCGDPRIDERERNGDEVGKRRSRAADSFSLQHIGRSQILVAALG